MKKPTARSLLAVGWKLFASWLAVSPRAGSGNSRRSRSRGNRHGRHGRNSLRGDGQYHEKRVAQATLPEKGNFARLSRGAARKHPFPAAKDAKTRSAGGEFLTRYSNILKQEPRTELKVHGMNRTEPKVGRGYAEELTSRKASKRGAGLTANAEMFNVINKFNVQAANTLYHQAGVPTAAFDSRQVQLGLKVTW